MGSGKLAPTLLIFHVRCLHSDRRFRCRDIVPAGDIYGNHWIRVRRNTTRYVTALRGSFLKERRKVVSCCSEGKNEGSVEWVPGLVYLWGIHKEELDSTVAVGCGDCRTRFLAVGWVGVLVLTGRYGRRIGIDSGSCLFRFTGRHVPPHFI